MSQQQPEHGVEQPGVAPPSFEPTLSEMEARRAHDDALRHPHQAATGEVIAGGHGRVEEETRRLSERMTREAQERHEALLRLKTAPLAPPGMAPGMAPATPQVATSLASAPVAPARLLPPPASVHATLVALDGSTFAERALPYAEALAYLTGSAIMLGMCVHRSGRSANAGEDIEAVGSLDEARTAEDYTLRHSMLAARDRLIADGIIARASVVRGPDAVEGLLLLKDSIGADAVALASHSRAGFERAVLGSVADELVRRGDGLTLVIPPLAPDASERPVTFERALAPFDGSALSEETLRAIQPLLQREPTRDSERGWLRALTLFFVAEDHAQVRDAEIYLHDLREALLHIATAPTEITPVVALGSAPGAIVARAAGTPGASEPEPRHDLILMATHGRGGVGRWFYGSVATYVLQHSTVPVLLMRSVPASP